MFMKTLILIILSALEIVAICVGVDLWFQEKRMTILPRIFWSLVLLIPFFGLLAFGFIRLTGEKNPDISHIDF